jgi:LysM repeat protein
MKNRFVLLGIVLVMALLAACQRSATTPLPTDTPAVVGGIQGETSGPDATMVALTTELWRTQTAQQAGATPEAPAAATATPISVATVAPTAAPVVATATPIVVATAVPPTAAPAACASPYTVKQGDWIYKIARECRLQPQAIIAANPGINPNRLTPGQKLNLPGAATAVPPTVAPGAPTATPPAQACSGTYTVKAGDNLFRIGFRCGFTTEQMAQVNNLRPPYRIFPGQVLKFP